MFCFSVGGALLAPLTFVLETACSAGTALLLVPVKAHRHAVVVSIVVGPSLSILPSLRLLLSVISRD